MNKNIKNNGSKKIRENIKPGCAVHLNTQRITPSHRQFVAWPCITENIPHHIAGRTKSGGYVAYPEG